jgi:hypothetical protein
MSAFKDKLIKDREKLKPIKNYLNISYHNLDLYNSFKVGCYNPNLFLRNNYKIGGCRG